MRRVVRILQKRVHQLRAEFEYKVSPPRVITVIPVLELPADTQLGPGERVVKDYYGDGSYESRERVTTDSQDYGKIFYDESGQQTGFVNRKGSLTEFGKEHLPPPPTVVIILHAETVKKRLGAKGIDDGPL